MLGLTTLGAPQPKFIEAKSAIELGPLAVHPGRTTNVASLLLVDIPPDTARPMAQRAKTLRATNAAKEKEKSQARWRTCASIHTNDAVVQDIFDKARYGLDGFVGVDGTMDAGIFEYGAQWVRDSSMTALGALEAGQFELARAVLDRILTKMITKEGVTMIGNLFVPPDMEQFDQMGELLHLLRNYRDWTGDDSLVREHRELLLALIERPLMPQFRDATGMVHNRREFWERHFRDAYELAYQTYVIVGLREAAELAPSLGAEDRAARWRAEADRMLQSLLSHPSRALVENGRLIKRRDVTGKVADDPAEFPGFKPDVPMRSEKHHRITPDCSASFPIFFRIVDPRGEIARRTLDDLEGLWNARWSDGGYDRYHTSSQPDQPGAWFTSTLVLRAQHEAGMWQRSRRTLEWLNSCPGGRAGTWFEEIPSNRSQMRTCGLVPWTSGDLAVFVVRHYLGVDFANGQVVIRPALYPKSPPATADLRFRQARLRLEITGSGQILHAVVNGAEMKPADDGSLRLPRDFQGGKVAIRCAN